MTISISLGRADLFESMKIAEKNPNENVDGFDDAGEGDSSALNHAHRGLVHRRPLHNLGKYPMLTELRISRAFDPSGTMKRRD